MNGTTLIVILLVCICVAGYLIYKQIKILGEEIVDNQNNIRLLNDKIVSQRRSLVLDKKAEILNNQPIKRVVNRFTDYSNSESLRKITDSISRVSEESSQTETSATAPDYYMSEKPTKTKEPKETKDTEPKDGNAIFANRKDDPSHRQKESRGQLISQSNDSKMEPEEETDAPEDFGEDDIQGSDSGREKNDLGGFVHPDEIDEAEDDIHANESDINGSDSDSIVDKEYESSSQDGNYINQIHRVGGEDTDGSDETTSQSLRLHEDNMTDYVETADGSSVGDSAAENEYLSGSQIDTVNVDQLTLQSIDKYTAKDLREMAKKLGVSIYTQHENKKRPKKKDELYEDLKNLNNT